MESEADAQDEIWSREGYSDFHNAGEGHAEVRSADQEETDLDESQLNEPIAQRAGELQKSRKRAGSTLSGRWKSRNRK